MNDKLFDDLQKSIRQAGNIQRGKMAASRAYDEDSMRIRTLRANLDLSQDQFAQMIGVSKRTLENWEQGRRKPNGAARVLLKVVEKEPRAVLRAVGE